MNKLPIRVMQNQNYTGKAQAQKLMALNSRNHGSFSVENLRNMNQTMPLSATCNALLAARYDTSKLPKDPKTSLDDRTHYSNHLTKQLLNKVQVQQQQLPVTQPTPLGSSTSTEMRYLSAKSPGAPGGSAATNMLIASGSAVKQAPAGPQSRAIP